ncbi:MAG: universal stress protein [Chloroflexi bacterium]|nr:universal stress protein [Chloroflexota bacterium]
MTVPAPCSILVGLEDSATAGVVATGASHIAMGQDAPAVILLHAIDTYLVAGGLLSMAGAMVPMVETGEDREAMLALAEAAIQAEYGALDRAVPLITRTVRASAPAAVIARVAKELGAAAIVVGARRPHAFGRLVHPDVRTLLAKCAKVPVHVVSLQADVSE